MVMKKGKTSITVKKIKIKHCRYCGTGRIIKHPGRKLVFCSLCGREFKK
jgi:ribosomal protein L37AE/L43A